MYETRLTPSMVSLHSVMRGMYTSSLMAALNRLTTADCLWVWLWSHVTSNVVGVVSCVLSLLVDSPPGGL